MMLAAGRGQAVGPNGEEGMRLRREAQRVVREGSGRGGGWVVVEEEDMLGGWVGGCGEDVGIRSWWMRVVLGN
jgi:hypothetical protein